MTRVVALTVFLAGCVPADAIFTEDPPHVMDTHTDTDTDTDADTDTDTDTEPDPYEWAGKRDFFFDFGGWRDCEDSLTEVGIEVTDDSSHLNAVQACADCDHVFLLDVSPATMCDGEVPVATTTYRGVKWSSSGADIYVIGEGSGGWYQDHLGDASGDATGLEYDYDGWFDEGQYEVQGYANIY